MDGFRAGKPAAWAFGIIRPGLDDFEKH